MVTWTSEDEKQFIKAQRELADAQREATKHTHLRPLPWGSELKPLSIDALKALDQQRVAEEKEHRLWRRKHEAFFATRGTRR